MQYPIVVRAKSTDLYTAEPLGLSELRVEAATETAALEQVRRVLTSWLGTAAKLVPIDLPDTDRGNPWLETFGRSADDPLFDTFLEEMAKARAEAETE